MTVNDQNEEVIMNYTKFDHVNFIIEYESGNCDEEQVIEGFQHLIDTGVVWHLQGSYGRTAAALIEAGLCSVPGKAVKS